ncbi:MAG: YceI family protein [Bacteroidetes bacterium]|nr:YceI family protein [Bacteroidota bacterium]
MEKILSVLAVFFFLSGSAQIYKAKDGGTIISFYSKSPLEDIDATNKGAIVVMNTNTSDLQVRVTIQNFKFKNALMEEHFNENYLESQKFPNAVFKGKINEKIDYTKDGDHKVTVTGKMEMHGVTKEETYEGTLSKKGNEITIKCKFKIKVADYGIKVPSLYVKNIAEVVDIDVHTVLEPFVKK